MTGLLDTNLYPMKIISFTQSFKFCSYITLHNDIFHFIFSQSIYIKIFRNKFQLYKNMLIMILMPNVESQFPHYVVAKKRIFVFSDNNCHCHLRDPLITERGNLHKFCFEIFENSFRRESHDQLSDETTRCVMYCLYTEERTEFLGTFWNDQKKR